MNKRNRKQLYLHSTILRGRRFKDEGEEGGATQGGSGDNGGAGGGNAGGATGVGASGADNSGENFDPSSFWDGPAPEAPAAPATESAGGAQSESGAQPNLATTLAGQINGLTFGEPIFNAEVADQINQGDFSGVQKRFESAMQTAVRQSLSMNVQVLQPFAEQILAQVREEFGSTLNTRDNQETLTRDFPAAKNPQVAPIIQGVFDQALTRSKGDRTAAVKMTKQMLSFMAQSTAGDLGLSVAPQSADDRRPATATNWLDELSGR